MSGWSRWLAWCGRIFSWRRREPLVEPWNAITVRVFAGPITLPPMGLAGIPVLPPDPAAAPVAAAQEPATPAPAPPTTGADEEVALPSRTRTAA